MKWQDSLELDDDDIWVQRLISNNMDNTIELDPTPTLEVTRDTLKVIGTKWVFRNKRDERSIVGKNKGRLVAQGFRQKEGIDYDEIFALVARIEAIRLFLAFASYMGFTVYQMDVKSAFLYVTIEEEVTSSTPIESNKPLVKDEDGKDVDVHVYRSMIGSLMYLTTSRPDIMFAVCACARESLERDIDGTEELLLPDLFILWLTKVSTDSAKLIPLGKDSTAIKTLEKIPPRV
ncbi:copia protein [Tanacetum coccineum]